MEDLELRVESLLLTASQNDLYNLSLELGMQVDTCQDKSALQCVKIMRKYIDQKEGDGEEEKRQSLTIMETFMDRKTKDRAEEIERIRKEQAEVDRVIEEQKQLEREIQLKEEEREGKNESKRSSWKS